MTDIKTIQNDGFTLTDRRGKVLSLALSSLKTALKAYFSTYRTMENRLHIFGPKSFLNQDEIDLNHFHFYWEACAETIIHFQHFAELVCKDILRAEHPLLSDIALSKPVILHKLLTGDQLSSEEDRGLRSIEFSEAYKRLSELIKEGRLKNSNSVDFIAQASWLKNLNSLRNRVWHRGIYILRYPALDKLVGEYILPFVTQVVALSQYTGQEGFWKYAELTCGIDPIESIIDEFRIDTYDLGKIALLKELGRAAYENPIENLAFANWFDEDKRRAERMAEAARLNVNSVRLCPVCGAKSLVVYDEIESEDGDLFNEMPGEAWQYTYKVKCLFCTFEIDHHLKNPTEYGLPIEDYWTAKQL